MEGGRMEEEEDEGWVCTMESTHTIEDHVFGPVGCEWKDLSVWITTEQVKSTVRELLEFATFYYYPICCLCVPVFPSIALLLFVVRLSPFPKPKVHS